MTAVMCSKWVGDYFTHPLYHALLELKCIPFLEEEPVVVEDNSRRVDLELCTAGQVMAAPAKTVTAVEKVRERFNETQVHVSGAHLRYESFTQICNSSYIYMTPSVQPFSSR